MIDWTMEKATARRHLEDAARAIERRAHHDGAAELMLACRDVIDALDKGRLATAVALATLTADNEMVPSGLLVHHAMALARAMDRT